MKRVKILLKCVIIISMFWGMTVGGPLSCGARPGGAGCGCVPSEEGELPPVFQYIVDLAKAIIFAIAPQIESGSKYIKQTFVGPKCGNIVDTTQLQYAGIEFTEPIDTSTFTIAGNISVEQIDYWSKVPVTFPVLSFDSAEFQNSNTRLVLWINRATIRPDTIYTITFTSPVANPVKTAKGETITTKIYKPPAQGGGLDHEEDLTLPWTFTVRVPDGVLPYITSFGQGFDLNRVPPHSEVLPTATFSEPMSMVAVQYEMFTGSGWVNCPCDPAVNSLCNECPGQGPLGLFRAYRTTYLSSGTYCSYATRDLSGEPLTPWPGSKTPGNVSYTYTTSKVRIEEPVVKPGEVIEYNINPINIGAKTTSHIMSLSGYTDPQTQSFNYPFKYSFTDGSKFFQYPFYSKYAGATTTRIFADAGDGGKDFVDVRMTPQPRIAKVEFPVGGLGIRYLCWCNRTDERYPLHSEEECRTGPADNPAGYQFPFSYCPFLTSMSGFVPGQTRVWIPKWFYNDLAAALLGGALLTGQPGFIIAAVVVELLNYVFDTKLELVRVEIEESHFILDDIDMTVPAINKIHFYLNYRLYVNKGRVYYFGGLYSYSLNNRSLFGGLKINYTLDFSFNEMTCQWSLPGCMARGLKVSSTQFDVSLDWVDIPGATGDQNNRARDELVKKVRENFTQTVDEYGLTAQEKVAKALKYQILSIMPTTIYFWDNNKVIRDTEGTNIWGLADLYSDNFEYRLAINYCRTDPAATCNTHSWDSFFNVGVFRGRRCDEPIQPAEANIPYYPQQAHYRNPDSIPFVWGFEQSQYWQWPSTERGYRNPIEIKSTQDKYGKTDVISVYLNYFDCIYY
jgi:hypothetical protein